MSWPDGHDDPAYTDRLVGSQTWWKRVAGAQLPYRWNIRRVVEGSVLDIGCGVGRNLLHLDGRGVGVDSNPHSVEVARQRGLVAYTPEEFPRSDRAEVPYGTLLFAHVLEHMTNGDAAALVSSYLDHLTPGGRVVIIVPQEAGFRSDPTHVDPIYSETVVWLAQQTGLVVERIYSFPFPRVVGRFFRHNETVGLLRLPR